MTASRGIAGAIAWAIGTGALTAGAAVAPAAAGPLEQVLKDDFDSGDFAKAGGLYYKKNAEQAAGTVEFQSEIARSGKALKLTVVPLCKPDDDLCSERAEIWERPNLRVPYEAGVWYGFSVRLGDPVPDDDHRYLIAQWKREIDAGADGDFSPFLALRLRQGRLFATVETNYIPPVRTVKPSQGEACPAGETPVWLRPETNQMRALVTAEPGFEPREDGELFTACTDRVKVTPRGTTLPAARSGWIDFAIYTRPGPSGGGDIEIFANGQWVVSVSGVIGHGDKGLGPNQYFKFGPYRAGHTTVWTVYYDDFRRSAECRDVLRGGTCPF